MSVKYCIDVPDNYAAVFWETLTQNFNVIITKRQHSVDGETLHIEMKISESKKQQYK